MYTKDNLQKALKDILDNKIKIYSASKTYQIPDCALSIEEENQIVEWIKYYAALGHPKTEDDLIQYFEVLRNSINLKLK